MASMVKCAHCGQDVSNPGMDLYGRVVCPSCGQPLVAGVIARVAPAPDSPAAVNRAIPVAVARLGGGPLAEGTAPPVARVASVPQDAGAAMPPGGGPAPVVARVVPPAAPVVARVAAAPVVARVAGPVASAPVVAARVAAPADSAGGPSGVPPNAAASDSFLPPAAPPSPSAPPLGNEVSQGQFTALPPSAEEPGTSLPGPFEQTEEPAPAHEYQHVMGELNVAADIFGGSSHAETASPEALAGEADPFGAESPYQVESPDLSESVSHEDVTSEPTAGQILEAQEAETALAREAVKPFALTTAGLAEPLEIAPILESVGESLEIVSRLEETVEEPVAGMESPAAGVEFTVDAAEAPAETLEPLTACAEVLAEEPVGDAMQAVAAFETCPADGPLAEPFASFEGIAAAEIAVPVCPVGGSVPSAAEEASQEAGTFAFTPARPGTPGFAPAPAAEGAAPRPAARRRRRRSQGGGIISLIGVMVSGFLGIALVYYAFNWLGGPKWDWFKFPLPGVRHTYKHLNRYPSLPRFGIDPDAATTPPKGGQPTESGNGAQKKAATSQSLQAAEESESAQPAEPVKKTKKNGAAAKKTAKPRSGPAKKADEESPFDMPAENLPTPDFSLPTVPAMTPGADKAAPPTKAKGEPAKKKAADDDSPFEMPAPNPADGLPSPSFSLPTTPIPLPPPEAKPAALPATDAKPAKTPAPEAKPAKAPASETKPAKAPAPEVKPSKTPSPSKANQSAKPQGEPAPKKAADSDAPFDMPAPNPADSLPKPNPSTPGSK